MTCAAVSAELDLVASGGADGAVLLHALRAGRFLRALRRGRPASRAKSVTDPTKTSSASARPWTGAFELGAPSWVALLEGRVGAARVLVYGGDALALSCFGVNADADAPPLAFVSLAERANALCVTPDERFIALAQERGSIAVRATHDLSPWAKLEGARAGGHRRARRRGRRLRGGLKRRANRRLGARADVKGVKVVSRSTSRVRIQIF